jgi:gentisate 1,2-dioxygenase
MVHPKSPSKPPVRVPKKLATNLKNIKPEKHGDSTHWSADLPTTVLMMHVEEISAGGTSTIHRHEEALIHVLSGQGYSEIQGNKVEWNEGGFLMIPANAWHRHWNTGDKPVRFVAAYASKLTRVMGAHYIEDKGLKTYKELKKQGLA